MSPLVPLRPSRPPRLAISASTSSTDLAHPLGEHRQGVGVEVADAVVLRQARLRAHAHRRGDAPRPAARADAARAAEVAGDQPQVVVAGELAHPLGDEPVAGAVEAPAAKLELVGPLVRHGVVPQPLGNRRVKAGFERRHQRHVRQPLAQLPHRRDVRRVVSRADGVHFRHGCDHFVVDPLHAAHAAAVHRLESDRRHVGDARQAAAVADR